MKLSAHLKGSILPSTNYILGNGEGTKELEASIFPEMVLFFFSA